jgi:hypothetical protein
MPVAIMPAVMATLLFILFRTWNLASYGIWGGEAFSVIGARLGWAEMMNYIIADVVHPPFFYVLLKLWILLGGDGVLWLKLLPVLIGISSIVPFYLLARELRVPRAAVTLALILIAFNGYLIHYSQELRMYVLLMSLTLWSLWAFVRYGRAGSGVDRHLLVLAVVNLLLVYSHYYGWIVVGMEGVLLLVWVRRKLPAFAVSAAILLALFLPWAVLAAQAAAAKGGLGPNLDWIPRPHRHNVVDLFAQFHGVLPFRAQARAGLAIFGAVIVLGAGQTSLRGSRSASREGQIMLGLALFVFAPLASLFMISHNLAQSVWISRYFVFLTIPYLLLVAMAADSLRPNWLRAGAIITLAAWGITAGIHDLQTNRMAWESPQLGSRVDWKALTTQLAETEDDESGPIVIHVVSVVSKVMRTGDYAVSSSLEYYLRARQDERFTFAYARDVHHLLSTARDARFWVAYFVLDRSDIEVREELERKGYSIEADFRFARGEKYVSLISVTRTDRVHRYPHADRGASKRTRGPRLALRPWDFRLLSR